MSQAHPTPQAPPGTWQPAHDLVQRLVRPVEQFLHLQAASGIALLVAALVALGWANSPFAPSYHHVWHTPVGLHVGAFEFSQSLHFWVNDGLMTVFFFVVGLEIRREMHEGELADMRRAALPVVAAVGGMVAPALIFWLLNRGLPSQRGWGVPTATDIAFAVGVLALLGKRVPAALRVLLLTLAIIDDIGAILVIALFYSSGLSVGGLLLAAGGMFGVLLWQWLGVRRPVSYLVPGFVIWLGCLRAGIHPTLAGVVLGLMTPVQPWLGERGFLDVIEDAIEEFRHRIQRGDHRAEDLLPPLRRVRLARSEALSVGVRLQSMLHPWVAFLIMPLFALANAGVSVKGVDLTEARTWPLAVGVVLGLVVGKPAGILLTSFVAVRTRLCTLPTGVTWWGVALVGCVAGIGFTMAIFVSSLAFTDAEALSIAKLAVLIASGAAGVVAALIGVLTLPAEPQADAATTPGEAECSAEK